MDFFSSIVKARATTTTRRARRQRGIYFVCCRSHLHYDEECERRHRVWLRSDDDDKLKFVVVVVFVSSATRAMAMAFFFFMVACRYTTTMIQVVEVCFPLLESDEEGFFFFFATDCKDTTTRTTWIALPFFNFFPSLCFFSAGTCREVRSFFLQLLPPKSGAWQEQ